MNEEALVDEDMEPDPELNRITNKIIGAAIEVHTQLKAGLLEYLYEEARSIEFRRRGIRFDRQVLVPVFYKGEKIGEQRLDFVVEKKVVLELKSVEQFAPIHTAQLICY